MDGVRVLDLTQIIAGLLATMHFRDYGAQWASLNRNKRSVTLDLSTESGRAALYDLAETTDVGDSALLKPPVGDMFLTLC